MNRQQRRQAKHKNPHLASRALFEEELRTALRRHDIRLVTCSTGQQGDEPRWVLEVRRGDTTLLFQSPPKTVEGMVAGIVGRLNGDVPPLPTPEVEPQGTLESTRAPIVPKDSTVTTKDGTYSTVTIHSPRVAESFEDLSRYLGEK